MEDPLILKQVDTIAGHHLQICVAVDRICIFITNLRRRCAYTDSAELIYPLSLDLQVHQWKPYQKLHQNCSCLFKSSNCTGIQGSELSTAKEGFCSPTFTLPVWIWTNLCTSESLLFCKMGLNYLPFSQKNAYPLGSVNSSSNFLHLFAKLLF